MAEELVYGEDEVTTGTSNDLQQVRNIARRMVAQWGFANDAMGEAPVAWESPEGNGLQNGKMASMETEVQILVSEAYDKCKELLTTHRALMDELTERLITDETVDYDELAKMRDAHFANLKVAA